MINVEITDRVAIITIQRPERRNAIGSDLVLALAAALSEADADSRCASIVLAGAAPGFCAGSDLKELGSMSVDQMVEHEAATAAMVRCIPTLSVSVVAAVEGFAIGGGFLLAAACDAVVSARDVRWHLPEVPLGWLPPWGLWALAARVSPAAARLLTLAEAPFDGAEALRLGVADRMVETGQARAVAVETALRLAALPRDARKATKQYFAEIEGQNPLAWDQLALAAFAQNCRSSEGRASLSRFGVRS